MELFFKKYMLHRNFLTQTVLFKKLKAYPNKITVTIKMAWQSAEPFFVFRLSHLLQ